MSKDRIQLNDATDRTRDVLGQRRTLVYQAERARQLTLQLRRSEMSQRYAEAKAARLEAMYPPQVVAKELRLFTLEAGLLQFLSRIILSIGSLRDELYSALREREAEKEWKSVELIGDKVGDRE